MINKLLNDFFALYYREWWNIAICEIGKDLTPQNIHWVKPTYNDRWFADPFIIDETEENYIVLVEEYIVPEHKGRLARLTINKENYQIINNETILDLPTHLSFPNYIEVDGKLYIYPENSKSGSLWYYMYDKRLEDGRLMLNQPLTDAVIFKYADSYYLLATQLVTCNGNICEVYKSTSPLTDYKLVQKIEFPDNIARSAGNIFEYEGKLIRPAQICNNAYGEGLSFQELRIIDGRIELREVKKTFPLTKDYPDGFHTYNVYGKKVIIDGYRYRSKSLRQVSALLLQLLIKVNSIRKANR